MIKFSCSRCRDNFSSCLSYLIKDLPHILYISIGLGLFFGILYEIISAYYTDIHQELPLLRVPSQSSNLHISNANYTTLPAHRSCESINWIHAPKTGSTLYLALQHLCCNGEAFDDIADRVISLLPDFDYNIEELMMKHSDLIGLSYQRVSLRLPCSDSPKSNGHLPLVQNMPENRSLMMFRNPFNRFVSSFMDSIHHEGLQDEEWKAVVNEMNEVTEGNPNITDATFKRLDVIASHPSFSGCYTKMLNGFQCTSSEPVTPSMVQHAKLRLKKLFFVGIFEEFNTSVALLHRTFYRSENFATLTPVHPVELLVYREHKHPSLKSMIISYLKSKPFFDANDQSIYQLALQIFQQRRQAYGL